VPIALDRRGLCRYAWHRARLLRGKQDEKRASITMRQCRRRRDERRA
jgi:hypothetical protein